MIFPLIGNKRVEEAVLSAISANRIPHAIIIEGEGGLGKHTLAAFIAKAAVCEGEEKPCGKCSNCHLAEVGSHPDIITVAAEKGKKSITIDAVREMRSDAYVKPHKAGKKVFIIDGADTLREDSQNALLKVLEEPPADIVFLLIAESKNRLLTTIISRCVILSLSAPERSDAAKYICEKNPQVSLDAALYALDNNFGSIGAALGDLTGKKSEIKTCAQEFLKAALIPDEWAMLSSTVKFANDRVFVDRFTLQLKLCVAEMMRKNASNVRLSRKLLRYYEYLSEAAEALKTNINLSLYFTLITSKAGEIFGG
ncbi:MAG: DNA polymerase III subunit delta' [Clostridia bacterium]|nr:DNA polymerase III subunit delta' [Clostridia bacterium]